MSRVALRDRAAIIALWVMLVGPLGLGGVLHGLYHHHGELPPNVTLDCGRECADPQHHHEPGHPAAKCPVCSTSPSPVTMAVLTMPTFAALDLGSRLGSRPLMPRMRSRSIWLIRAPPVSSFA